MSRADVEMRERAGTNAAGLQGDVDQGVQCGYLLPSGAIRTADAPLFLDNVETHLPSVISTLRLTQSHANCMTYADGIVGVNVRPELSLDGATPSAWDRARCHDELDNGGKHAAFADVAPFDWRPYSP